MIFLVCTKTRATVLPFLLAPDQRLLCPQDINRTPLLIITSTALHYLLLPAQQQQELTKIE